MGDVRLRPLRAEEAAGDVAELCALTNRAHAHDRIPEVVDEAELAEELGRLDPALDAQVAEADGAVCGYAHVWYVPSGERLERAYIHGTVDPAHRGRGVGRELLRWGTTRAQEVLAAADAALPKVIHLSAYEQVEDAHRLARRMGFAPVRWFEELLRPLVDLPPGDVTDGYDIVDWPHGRDEELCDVRNEAFTDHWGSTPWTATRFDEMTTGYGARTDLSVVAVERATGRVVGICLNEHYPQDAALIGRTDGWIAVLGTRAAHRGRGLASAMIRSSLHRFVAAGFTHASIGVDADSPTGANRLYRTLGFRPEQRRTTFEVRVD